MTVPGIDRISPEHVEGARRAWEALTARFDVAPDPEAITAFDAIAGEVSTMFSAIAEEVQPTTAGAR